MANKIDAIARPTLVRWHRAIAAAFGLGGITTATWGPRLPALKGELHMTTGTIGLVLVGVTVGAIGGLLVSSPVLHRLGARRALSTALLLVAAAIGLLAAAAALGSVVLLGVSFVIVGLGIGTLDVLINVEGAAIERLLGRTAMPRMHASWSIGVAIGSGIGAGCAALGITPAMQFLVEAILVGASGVLMAPHIPPGSRSEEVAHGEGRVARVRTWLRGWTDWRLLLIGVVMLGVELGEGSANNWLTLAVRNDHGESAAIAALFFTAFAVGEATARLFGGRVVDRLGRVHAIRYTTAPGMLGVALFILGRAPGVVLLGVVLWAVGVSMGFPLGMSAAAEGAANAAARVSVVASIGYFANLAGPPAIGLLAQSAGLLNALWLLAALMFAAFAVAGALRARPDARPHAVKSPA